jgi:hypothetical protein
LARSITSGSSGAPCRRPFPSKLLLKTVRNDNADAVAAEALEPDDIVDLVRAIECLKQDQAVTRLLEREDDQEKFFFETGGLLSAVQKHKWFGPFGSLDEWVEKNTAIRRAKARALIQIYDAIIESGIKWVVAKHLEWTKLRAIAGVLHPENASHGSSWRRTTPRLNSSL